MKYLKYTLFIMIIFLNFNVFADSYNVSSTITSPSGGSSAGGKYQGTELNGSTGPFNINTRYNGTLTNITYNLIKPSGIEGDCFWTNMTYTITMEMATSDWRNRFGTVSVKPYSNYGTNWSNGRVTFVSMKKIYFTFKIPSSYTTCESSVVVNLSSNDLFNPFTGETNWNLSKITLSDTLSSGSGSGGSSGGTSTPTPTPDISGPIIDNQNQNTNNIIDNQNQNTSDIIENNNQNTQDIIKSNQSCYTENDNIPIKILPGFDLIASGIRPNLTWEISSFIPVYEGVNYGSAGWSSNYYCVYDINFNLRRCNSSAVYITQPGDAFIVRNSTISGANNPRVWGQGSYCVNKTDIELRQRALESKGLLDKQDTTNEKLNDINNSINNSNVDDKTSFFTNFNNDTHGLTGIITLPLSTIQSLTNSSCVALSIPIPFTNSNVSLPCMTEVYSNYIPNVYSIWQVVSFGIISYFICLDIFKMVKGFKDPNEDKVEVLDL